MYDMVYNRSGKSGLWGRNAQDTEMLILWLLSFHMFGACLHGGRNQGCLAESH